MKIHPQTIVTFLSLTYFGFIITNLMTLFCDFHMGIKANTTISLMSDIFFLMYIRKDHASNTA